MTPPQGFVQVSKDEFWKAVMAETRNIHPYPDPDTTSWKFVGTSRLWGWVSEGYRTSSKPVVYARNPETM